MIITDQDVKQWIKNLEGQTIDFKSYDILSHAHDLAELMVAFGNNKFVSEDYGGKIIIGINNQKEIEHFEAKQGHEELIMNVARDKCSPSIHPEFQDVKVDDNHVYVITIPKMTEIPFQLIGKDGKTHRIRIGSTIREPNSQELEKLYSKSPILNDKVEQIIKKFPSQTDVPFRHITIIPIDNNSKLIDYNVENTDWFKINRPKTCGIRHVKLIQNEIHYEGGTFPSSGSCWGIFNDFGSFSWIEVLNNKQKTVFIEREAVFLIDILEYVKLSLTKFGYDQRLYIHYRHNNVQNYDYTCYDTMHPYHFNDVKILLSDFLIERTVSMSSLDSQKLTNSILEEIARTCNWSVNTGEFDKFISQYRKSSGI